MADKLRTTYPLKITFYEGEQPTALKLSAISSQSKTGLKIVEKAIGNIWGNGGDANAKGLQIPTLGRVLGENKYLNPALYALYNDTPFYYIQKISTDYDGETTGYLTFVPHNPGSGFDIIFGNGAGAAITSYVTKTTEPAVTEANHYWIDSVNSGSTGKFRFGTAFNNSTTPVYIGYWVNPADWDLAQEDIVPGVIPDPRSTNLYPNGGTLVNYLSAPATGSGSYSHTITLPLRAPLVASGSTGYAGKLPFQLPKQTEYSTFDLNSLEGASGHAAFPATKVPRLWSYTTPGANIEFYRYRVPVLEPLSTDDKIPDGSLYLCYIGTDGNYEIIEGLEFHKSGNTYDINIKDNAGLLAAKITAVDTAGHNPKRWGLITCNPSVTKRLWALDHSFSHHTHDGTHGDKPFDNLIVDGTIDGGLVVANAGDATTSGFSFDSVNNAVQAGIQWHQGSPDANPINGLTINSKHDVIVNLDVGGDGTNKFAINDHGNTEIFSVDESGNTIAAGKVDADYFNADEGTDATNGYGFGSTHALGVLGLQYNSTNSRLELKSPTNIRIILDSDEATTDSGNCNFQIFTGTGSEVFSVNEAGVATAALAVDAGFYTSDTGNSSGYGYGFSGSSHNAAGMQYSSTSLWFNSEGNVSINLDTNDEATNNKFNVNNGAGTEVFSVNESGTVNTTGAITGTSLNAGSGAIQTTGSITGGSFGAINAGSGTIQTTGNVGGGTVTSSGTITATGNITTSSGEVSTHNLSLLRSGSNYPTLKFETREDTVNGNNQYWDITANSSTHGTSNDGDLAFYYGLEGDSTPFLRGLLRSDVSTGGNMNFTGQHTNISEDPDIQLDIENHIGLIVSSVGYYRNVQEEESIFNKSITINEALPKIALSIERTDKKVFGVISNAEDPSENRVYKAGAFVTPLHRIPGDERITINSLGEGAIWVCSVNGNLLNGDYITSCEIPGLGMLQSDDILHNYTVAKITCDCDFDLNSTVYTCEEFQFNGDTYKKAFVGCTYHCG